jgi:hypothetical protein
MNVAKVSPDKVGALGHAEDALAGLALYHGQRQLGVAAAEAFVSLARDKSGRKTTGAVN